MLSRAVCGPLDRVRRVSRVMQGMIVFGAGVALLALSWAWLGPSVIEKDFQISSVGREQLEERLGPSVVEKDVLTSSVGRGHLKLERKHLTQTLRFPVEDVAMTDQVQLIVLTMWSLLTALVLYALYQAYQLFAGYRCGEVLTVRAAGRLRHISYAMLAVAVAVPIGQAVLSVVLSWKTSSGQLNLNLVLPVEASDYFIAALAGLLLAIAYVLTEAAKIARENSEIV